MKLKHGMNLYRDRLNVIIDSEVVQSIRIDLPRTFPENIYFVRPEGCQEQLFRVLFAFAADNREIGYCQVGFRSEIRRLYGAVRLRSEIFLFIYFKGLELYRWSLITRDQRRRNHILAVESDHGKYPSKLS